MKMLNSKKSQWVMVGMMVSFVVIIFAFQLVDPLRDMVTDVRSATGLDCANTSISTGTKLTCIAVDLSLPTFVWVCLFASFAYLTGKKVEYTYQPPTQ